MKKVIVTTSIHPGTEAIQKFDRMEGWDLIVTGDIQSPSDYELENGTYISWEEQKELYPEICKLIGPMSWPRGRIIGFIEAYKRGADIVASVDDDNIPLDNWGKEIVIGQEIEVTKFITDNYVFDPLVAVKSNLDGIWHRGFPLQQVRNRENNLEIIKTKMVPKVQENLWLGDPDVDSVCRQLYRPYWNKVEMVDKYISTNVYSPFNTQNTMIDACYLKDFMCIPDVGRQDDFWGAYLFEYLHPESVVYGEPTVRQERNYWPTYHNDQKDMQGEYQHFTNTDYLLWDLVNTSGGEPRGIPPEAWLVRDIYRSYFGKREGNEKSD